MSSTMTIELPRREQQEPHTLPSAPEQPFGPTTQAKQKWNQPSINKWQILATFVSFAMVGASDGVHSVSFDGHNRFYASVIR